MSSYSSDNKFDYLITRIQQVEDMLFMNPQENMMFNRQEVATPGRNRSEEFKESDKLG